ncbi:signal peptidase I [Thermotomaculum hydrothermale]|uniref:Signal peptidase I n=1 Tax=Thermotomaculum hydrothermale TaxID=981385 RepID=A0A7R6PDW5_9BACT|nr:signal peptidase I [Thermotomaculum hydrothermale]BBB31954.1 signal peptidase I [Thermotomaculum hydrothermale]
MQDLIVDFLRRTKNFVLRYKIIIAFSYAGILTVFLLFSLFYRPVVVSGSSMLPTLTNNETVFIKRNVGINDIHRGDIIVFYSPLDHNKLLIKRVIALPDDTVAIVNGDVYVNGKLLQENYLNGVKSHETIPLLRVPPKSFFVLGDNRVISSDSREFGCVRFESVYGKLVFTGEETPTK